MRILDYGFGRIDIDGKEYRQDLIILPQRVISPWRRIEGHNLAPEDLAEVLDAAPPLLVIGTGYYGRLEVPRKTQRLLRERDIETLIARTTEAVALFNDKSARDIAAALHLTC